MEWFLFLPFALILPRALNFIKNVGKIRLEMPDGAKKINEARSYLSFFVGLSFAGIWALAAMQGNASDRLHALWYMLFSFFFSALALEMQSYKRFWWQDELSLSFFDVSTVCLMLSVVSLIWSMDLPISFKAFAAAISWFFWGIDFFTKIKLAENYWKHPNAGKNR